MTNGKEIHQLQNNNSNYKSIANTNLNLKNTPINSSKFRTTILPNNNNRDKPVKSKTQHDMFINDNNNNYKNPINFSRSQPIPDFLAAAAAASDEIQRRNVVTETKNDIFEQMIKNVIHKTLDNMNSQKQT